MNRFVVAGRKIDDLALMLVRAFFSLKNRVDKYLGKSHDALLLGFLVIEFLHLEEVKDHWGDSAEKGD
jgi:hypothetical protein